jgi:ribosomal protein S18 acetylase RimI-like enzyme
LPLSVRSPIIPGLHSSGLTDHPKMPAFDIVITHLELSPADFRPKRSSRTDVAFSHVSPPMPELNRFFYCAVGAQWFWLDRRPWTLAQWSAQLENKDRIETWILSAAGVPAGYVELERKDGGAVEIKYLGLLKSFIGGGLGAHLLTAAVERAMAMGATKVLLDTCTLDHPQALANYQARGFRPVRTETKTKEIPVAPPGPWEGA